MADGECIQNRIAKQKKKDTSKAETSILDPIFISESLMKELLMLAYIILNIPRSST